MGDSADDLDGAVLGAYADPDPDPDLGRGWDHACETVVWVTWVMMFAGIATLGVVTASFASWFVERVAESAEHAEAATRRDIAALTAEIRALREQAPERRAPRSGGE